MRCLPCWWRRIRCQSRSDCRWSSGFEVRILMVSFPSSKTLEAKSHSNQPHSISRMVHWPDRHSNCRTGTARKPSELLQRNRRFESTVILARIIRIQLFCLPSRLNRTVMATEAGISWPGSGRQKNGTPGDALGKLESGIDPDPG